VLLRAGDGYPPLFLVHGLGGGVVGYADLVAHLGGSFAVYGLNAAGLEDDAAPDPTIAAMAARYLRAIRTLQPHGPYRLGGYCYGGVVAFEMAQQLAAGGEAVPLLAIIEGTAPGARRDHGGAQLRPRLALALASLPFWWREYRTLGPDVLRRRVLRKVQACTPAGGPAPAGRLAEAPVDDDLSLLPARRQQLLAVHLRAIRSYTPGPYAGRALLFRGRDRTISQVLRGPLDPTLGWGRLARTVTVTAVPGAHRNVHLEPHAPALAAALTTYLVSPEGEIPLLPTERSKISLRLEPQHA
jgi:thioesterase domain-containing protein